MLVVHPIGPEAGRYYESGPRGTWLGGGAAALGLSGAVDPADLAALLRGRSPAAAGHPRRRAGWDWTFAAPKGVSLVAGLLDQPGEPGQALVAAHRAAVDESLGFAARHALWVQRGGDRFLAAGDGLVAARFEHTSTVAGDPHLHTHVLIVNALAGPDGRWSAVATSPLWRSEREAGAIYGLGLRHHARRGGVAAAWTTGTPVADLAGVPRRAIAAVSRRQGEIAEHRTDGRSATGRSAARAVTRPAAGPAATDWREATAAAGFSPEDARALAASVTAPVPEVGTARLGEVLGATATSFTVRDVIRALERESPAGMSAVEAEGRAERFCAGAEPAATRGRWTTARARDQDREISDRIDAGRGLGLAVVGGRRAAVTAADPALDAAGAAAVSHLLGSGDGVEILAGRAGVDELGSQAAVIDAARRAWQADGYRVTVAGTGRRWEPLTSLGAQRDGPAPDVLVVDGADRLAPPMLAAAMDRAATTGTKLVLVEGGTLPRRGRAHCEAVDQAERLECGTVDARPTRQGPLARAGGIVVVGSGRDAVAHLTDRAARHDTLLVGAGPAEVHVLNAAVRHHLAAAGGLTGPALTAGGRWWQAGDRVLALRADRSAGVPAGRLGTVSTVDDGRRPGLAVAWDAGGTTELARHRTGFLGWGWATTPPLAALTGRDLAVLGEPAPVLRRERTTEAVIVVPATAREPRRHPSFDRALAERDLPVATPEPTDRDRSITDLMADRRRLETRGPSPPTDHEVRRWEALGTAIDRRQDVANAALERSPGVSRDRGRDRPMPTPELDGGLGLG